VIKEQVKAPPAGVGVDSPLWWSSGPSSDRQADQWLRRTYGFSGGQVQTVNSLRGAALIQGVMFVRRLRQLFPDVGVTETHPKTVWYALKVNNWDSFSRRFLANVTIHPEQEHERDAIISAVAAREGFEGRWPKDLSTVRHPSEQDPLRFWLAPIHYFWPDK
jgi:predicted nuclease with RNAse H fold